MAENVFLSELLGLEKLRVTGTQIDGAERITLFVESVEEVASCPECGELSLQVYGLCEEQVIRDLPFGERHSYLSYRARRYRCSACGKTFVEQVAWKRAETSYTLRYEKYIYQRARKEPVSQIAEDEGFSEEVMQTIFEHWAKKRLRHGGTRKSM